MGSPTVTTPTLNLMGREIGDLVNGTQGETPRHAGELANTIGPGPQRLPAFGAEVAWRPRERANLSQPGNQVFPSVLAILSRSSVCGVGYQTVGWAAVWVHRRRSVTAALPQTSGRAEEWTGASDPPQGRLESWGRAWVEAVFTGTASARDEMIADPRSARRGVIAHQRGRRRPRPVSPGLFRRAVGMRRECGCLRPHSRSSSHVWSLPHARRKPAAPPPHRPFTLR